jgi:IS30 family transposase
MEGRAVSKKRIQQTKEALAGIKYLSQIAEQVGSTQQLIDELEILICHIRRTANEKNNRPNKNIMAFVEYFREVSKRKRDAQTVKKKATAKRLKHKITYKDYISEILILRNQDKSYQEIAEYCRRHFKIKVSKSTIYRAIKEAVK